MGARRARFCYRFAWIRAVSTPLLLSTNPVAERIGAGEGRRSASAASRSRRSFAVCAGLRAGFCLLLVLAQPLTRLARLTVEDVDDHRRPVRLRLGSDPLEPPEPLGALVAELKQRRPRLAATAADDGHGWLFPGLRLDAPLHPERLRRRLRTLGIPARPGRAAALLHLAQTLPPAILADLLGISESRAADWSRAATGDWARFAAAASQRLQA
jgi:hypothetical protein